MVLLMCYCLSKQQECLIDSPTAKERRGDWDNTWGTEQHLTLQMMVRLLCHHEGREMERGLCRDGTIAEIRDLPLVQQYHVTRDNPALVSQTAGLHCSLWGLFGCSNTELVCSYYLASLPDVWIVFGGTVALIVVTVVTAVLITPAKKPKLKNVEVLVALWGAEVLQTICRKHGTVCAADREHHDLPGGDGDFWLPF